MPLPPLTPEQRADALSKATEARRVRAAARDRLRSAGPRTGDVLAAILDEGGRDDALGKMRVAALLEALQGIGKVRAAAIMDRLAISQTRRVRGLGVKQRAALVREFSAGTDV